MKLLPTKPSSTRRDQLLEIAEELRNANEEVAKAEEAFTTARAHYKASPQEPAAREKLAQARLARTAAVKALRNVDLAMGLASRQAYGTRSAIGWRAFLPDLPVVVMVLLAGAVGGWIAQQTGFAGNPVHGFTHSILDPASDASAPPAGIWMRIYPCFVTMIVGACAAGVAVFFLAKTDTTKVWHCFFFALICGVTGYSIIERATKTVDDGNAAENVQQASVTVKRVNQKLESLDTAAGLQEAATDLKVAGVAAVQSADQAKRSSDVRIENAADRTAFAAVENLQKVGEIAIKTDGVTPDLSINALNEISAKAEITNNPAVARAASEAVATLVEQSQDTVAPTPTPTPEPTPAP